MASVFPALPIFKTAILVMMILQIVNPVKEDTTKNKKDNAQPAPKFTLNVLYVATKASVSNVPQDPT
jgi:uncharacterized membrane protein YadS